jgi:hypothetical protein
MTDSRDELNNVQALLSEREAMMEIIRKTVDELPKNNERDKLQAAIAEREAEGRRLQSFVDKARSFMQQKEGK